MIALASRITETAHKLIVGELELRGIHGVVPSHGGILTLLFTGDPFTMKDLAEKIHRTKPTVTVLVDKLVSLGYVIKEKSRKDNRSTFIKLTEEGWKLKLAFLEISESVNSLVYKGLSDKEAECAEAILGKIKRNLEEAEEPLSRSLF